MEPQPLQERVDIPLDLAWAVDILVDAYGREGAEEELQARFHDPGQKDRATAGLAYLRRRYAARGEDT